MSPFLEASVQNNLVLISYCCSLIMVLTKWNPFLVLLLCNLSVAACSENFTAAICSQLLAWLEAQAHCRRCTLVLHFLRTELKSGFIVLCVGNQITLCVQGTQLKKRWNVIHVNHITTQSRYWGLAYITCKGNLGSYWNAPQLTTTPMYIAHHMTSSIKGYCKSYRRHIWLESNGSELPEFQ